MSPIIQPVATLHMNNDAENFDEIEQSYRDQVEQFLKENTALANVACVGIETGYTDRILDNSEIGFAVCFPDEFCGADMQPTVNDSGIFELMKGVRSYDTVVFAATSADAVFDKIGALRAADYCGCCSIESLMRLDWYEVKGQNVVVACLDCESG